MVFEIFVTIPGIPDFRCTLLHDSRSASRKRTRSRSHVSSEAAGVTQDHPQPHGNTGETRHQLLNCHVRCISDIQECIYKHTQYIEMPPNRGLSTERPGGRSTCLFVVMFYECEYECESFIREE